ncbi:ATP-binding cassette domain-containing protein [Candidatus Lokiarchaeum ossiferum]|uniref:ATP-binding cassette domain-containing protein n=1 Tax=Candidatus Lokiarchaeum ossiferum TaxID=2951803 RepID=UPI00352DC4D9
MVNLSEIQTQYAIEVKNLKKHFKDVKAVDGATLKVQQGELFSLLGPNGAGKTTLVRMLTTVLTPTSGEATINGLSINKKKKDIVKLIGVCPQENVVYDQLTAEENVIFTAQMHSIPLDEAKKKTGVLLEKLGIGGKDRWAKKFSGGMKKRLNVAMSLIHEPSIIFLDEPSAGLDPQARRILWDFIKDMKGKGNTIILMTHDMIEADALSDHISIIDNGKIIAYGTPKDLKAKYGGDNIIEIVFKKADQKQEIKNRLENLSYISSWKENGDFALIISLNGGITYYLKFLNEMQEFLQDGMIEDLKFRPGSLEDVFLNLTGRRFRD